MLFGEALFEDSSLAVASWDGIVGLGFEALSEVLRGSGLGLGLGLGLGFEALS